MKNKKNKKQAKMVNISYPVGDFLIRLKNACMAGHKNVSVGKTKLIRAVAETLEKEGFLDSIEEADNRLIVGLTYRKKEPILMDVKHVSKPGLRVYMGSEDIAKRRAPTVLIVSTSQGVMTARDAVKKKLGGELIAEIL